jgi:hypothetical protein
MKALHERHEKVVTRAFHKKLAVTKQAAKLRAVHEEKQHKLAQGYGGYGGYGGSGGYGGYGGYGGGYGNYDDYGNEVKTAEEEEQEGVNIDAGVENLKSNDYYENMLYGLIDGLTADFDTNCSSSLYGVVNGGFRAIEYKNVYNPQKTIKFQMAINNFTESTNSVYTFCDFSAFFTNIAMYTDTENVEQYIQIASRISGSMVQ